MTMHKVDHGIIESCRQGDREAFRVIFETYKDKVYSMALYYFNGDTTAAKDLTQEVFVKLLTRMEQFRGDAEFSTWLYRVVANACLDERRKGRRWFSLEDSVEVGHMVVRQSLEMLQLQREVASSVKSAIASLKPKLRIAILLKYFEELSYEEIASVLGCSVGTVASRLNRGHKLLAKKLAHFRKADAL
ncbi:MAG: sigma-70 family RNA polymerase sigma factor [Acidobacteria bacterium]|nr:sigma-70 family RNA polymerase sigma factor [Acidobacteriota bacterium]MCI0627978.1 sigma-70 family RNA polymerase sigma factor [Acidobacteriota bacterium]MCI0719880.1 sigma-70 family RNA polymerase sigma factor [Acidobacteriota bacterium]